MNPTASTHGIRLRLLSYNIQVGISSRAYHDYVGNSWKHFLPSPGRSKNLDNIAQTLRGYDIVGLQEVDAGSLRSQYINQTEYLATRAGLPFWKHQTNRDWGHLAKHSLGLLARYTPYAIEHHSLPGIVPGRGVMLAYFGHDKARLAVAVMHLALGRGARFKQMAFVAELLHNEANAVLMGDFNCLPHSPELTMLQQRSGLLLPEKELPTFPSWRPNRMIDYILLSPSLRLHNAEVLRLPHSDHLPLAVEIECPPYLHL
ncbi:MAG: endonuclease/exonuclease/phosphatase family protein [Halothiobacillaceae bacterium]